LYPSQLWFAVDGADDGVSVWQFATVYRLRLDGLNAMVSKRTNVHFLNENERSSRAALTSNGIVIIFLQTHYNGVGR
jgi:hypothetical protein